MDTKKEYLKAQQRFEENRILAQKGGNEGKIKTNILHIWETLHKIFEYKYNKESLDKSVISKEIKLGDKDIETILYVISNYDKEKGKLENFANMVWSKRKKPTNEERYKGSYHTISNGEILSLNDKIGEEDNEVEIIDTISDSDSNILLYDMEVKEEKLAYIIEIASAINQFCQRKYSKKNMGIKLVFTDIVTDICKNVVDNIDKYVILNRQKTIINGMDMDFLDFYMKERCRSLKEIKITSLKKWCELPFKDEQVKEKYKYKELEIPLSNKVYTCFLYTIDKSNKSLNSTVSQYKKEFTDTLKEIGLKKIYSVYNENINNSSVKRKLKSITNTPLLDIILDYFEILQTSNQKFNNKEVNSKIDNFMKYACKIIMDSYLNIKSKETYWIEEYKIKYAKSYIDNFIDSWNDNFNKKYNFIQDKKINGKVPQDIKLLALQEIENKITKDNSLIEIILKSLDFEFAERKSMNNDTILENITKKAFNSVKHKTANEVSKDVPDNITSQLVKDTIDAIEQSSSRSITTIVKNIQNNNLYRYYWI